jgi:phospholipid/cholesterol/gamma-HCH transport system permease protein
VIADGSAAAGSRRALAVERESVGARGVRTRIAARALGVLHFVGEFVSVLARGLIPGNWRRTMRAEFASYLYQVGVRAIPVVAIAASLIGIALVVQIVYWLHFAGEEERIGEFIVLTLVRQIAPIGTVLIIIGRSGSVLVDEIGELYRSGYAHALASHGIDPTDFITIPRAFAMSVAAFLLTMVFLHMALVSGYLAASLAGVARRTPLEFIGSVFGILSIRDHALLIAKPLVTGYVVGYLSIWFGSRVGGGPQDVRRALPKAFVTSLIATVAIGALFTALL